MADNPLEQVLLEMGLDLSPIQNAGKVVLATMADLNKVTDQYQAASAAAGAAQLSQVKQAAQAAVQAALVAVSEENKKQALLNTQTAELKKQAQEQALLAERSHAYTVAEQARLSSTKLETAELEKQTAELLRQIAAIRAKNAAGGGHGEAKGFDLGSAAKKLGTAALGNTLGTALIGGMAGGGIALLAEMAVGKIEGLIEKLKEVTVEASKLSQVSDVFERIAKGAGLDATEMMNKMRDSTEGLADRFTLTKIAVAGLSGSLKLNHTQIEQLVGDVTKLAEAHGKSAEHALQMTQRMLESGTFNARMMGRMIGESIIPLSSFGSTMDNVARKAAIASDSIKQIHERAERLGELPQTLEQVSARMAVASKDLFMAFGQGFNKSAGVQVFIDIMHQLTDQMEGMVGTSRTIGQTVGDSFLVVGVVVRSIISVFESLWEVIKKVFDILSDELSPLSSLRKIRDSGDETVKKFKELHPVLKGVTDAIIDLTSEIKIMLLILSEGLDRAQKVQKIIGGFTAVGSLGAIIDIIEKTRSNYSDNQKVQERGDRSGDYPTLGFGVFSHKSPPVIGPKVSCDWP